MISSNKKKLHYKVEVEKVLIDDSIGKILYIKGQFNLIVDMLLVLTKSFSANQTYMTN